MSQRRGMQMHLTQYGDTEFSIYLRKAFIKAMGYSDDALDRPVIGIANTYSSYNACHANSPKLIESIKRGVMLAGGLPMDFPTISLHESFSYPTSMYLRNLMAMDTEEMLLSLPMDACVLVGGCDKTVPAQLMAAASADIPSISVVTGPMLSGSYEGRRIGACTDCRYFWAEYRGNKISHSDIKNVEERLAPTSGTCGVMGTASTIACMTEALGMMLPGGSTIPSVFSDRLRHGEDVGRKAVRISQSKILPSMIMTPDAFENALRVLLAIGGSTNAIIHFTAIAGRLGFEIDLKNFDDMGSQTPVLVDLKPSGQYYMDDLYKAGGLSLVLSELAPLLNLDCLTVSGKTIGEEIENIKKPFKQNVVHSLSNPLHSGGGIAYLRGNLAGDGAIIKQSAASPELLTHSGKALVFHSLADLAARIDDPSLEVTKDNVLILRNAGPKGAPGMPEAGYIPIPKKLAAQGIRDMVRISDCRMSGTAFGTIVLHASPEAAIGGPLALVENGDVVTLDTPNRTLTLDISEEEFKKRKLLWQPSDSLNVERGYQKLYMEHITQANRGVDFDFLIKQPITKIIPTS